MSKSVLISIHPKWCENIANGEKTIEVRKTQPKIDMPFKCYIYCTNDRKTMLEKSNYDGSIYLNGNIYYPHKMDCSLNGKVIGEFVCDTIITLSFYSSDISFFDTNPPFTVPDTCLTDKEIAEYLGNGKTGYGWHISDLKIYNKPKELNEFYKPCPNDVLCAGCKHAFVPDDEDETLALIACDNRVTKPPQSWCYVSEMMG